MALSKSPLVQLDPLPASLSADKQRRVTLTLREIFKKHGRVEAEFLVEAARNPKHRMHQDFDWDVKRNAARWLIHQAAMYICSVKVRFKEEGPTFRMMYNVRLSDGSKAFVPHHIAFGVTENREQVLDKAIRTFRLVRDRYRDLQELAKVFEAIDEL